ncbi:hypothetical protein TRFO_13685 [Tritrichomonas foetus]|uniref:Uncharacterized protein n=1 Tax=Tritrichomonas foetus TaxID=1144522 RepID=A0A1J4KX81_9EUKA|nr:hypothetical protein TRFO_13685 [Tritrichomonas foetus]|eukprot:OHT15859.1 hypothetical protein TRFO_13685 [Tritrichomonas foetus]
MSDKVSPEQKAVINSWESAAQVNSKWCINEPKNNLQSLEAFGNIYSPIDITNPIPPLIIQFQLTWNPKDGFILSLPQYTHLINNPSKFRNNDLLFYDDQIGQICFKIPDSIKNGISVEAVMEYVLNSMNKQNFRIWKSFSDELFKEKR